MHVDKSSEETTTVDNAKRMIVTVKTGSFEDSKAEYFYKVAERFYGKELVKSFKIPADKYKSQVIRDNFENGAWFAKAEGRRLVNDLLFANVGTLSPNEATSVLCSFVAWMGAEKRKFENSEPIWRCAHNVACDIVLALLNQGANPFLGLTPKYSLISLYAPIFLTLLAHMPNIEKLDSNNLTPVFYVYKTGVLLYQRTEASLFRNAISQKLFDEIMRLFLKARVDLSPRRVSNNDSIDDSCDQSNNMSMDDSKNNSDNSDNSNVVDPLAHNLSRMDGGVNSGSQNDLNYPPLWLSSLCQLFKKSGVIPSREGVYYLNLIKYDNFTCIDAYLHVVSTLIDSGLFDIPEILVELVRKTISQTFIAKNKNKQVLQFVREYMRALDVTLPYIEIDPAWEQTHLLKFVKTNNRQVMSLVNVAFRDEQSALGTQLGPNVETLIQSFIANSNVDVRNALKQIIVEKINQEKCQSNKAIRQLISEIKETMGTTLQLSDKFIYDLINDACKSYILR